MTESAMPDMMRLPDEGFDAMARTTCHHSSSGWQHESADVTGGVRGRGRVVGVADGWQHGPRVDKGARWTPAELVPVVRDLLDKAPQPTPAYGVS